MRASGSSRVSGRCARRRRRRRPRQGSRALPSIGRRCDPTRTARNRFPAAAAAVRESGASAAAGAASRSVQQHQQQHVRAAAAGRERRNDSRAVASARAHARFRVHRATGATARPTAAEAPHSSLSVRPRLLTHLLSSDIGPAAAARVAPATFVFSLTLHVCYTVLPHRRRRSFFGRFLVDGCAPFHIAFSGLPLLLLLQLPKGVVE